MKWFRLILHRFILILALFPALLMVSSIIREQALELYSRAYFKYTYIEMIDTPSYGTSTERYLREFNLMAESKIISFSHIDNGRPIVIREMEDFYEKMFPNTLGVSQPGFSSCFILVKKGQKPAEYRETVLHEYLHCMGYMHVADRDDLMYFAMNPVDKEENIRQYAKRLEKKFYE